jgi:hypothetical protein
MLPGIKKLARRSRRGVVALAIPVTLAFPVAASASVWGPVYANQAQAAAFFSGQTSTDVRFQLDLPSLSTVNVLNEAQASTSRCDNCSAVAISFQVLFAAGVSSADVYAQNTADAVSTSCTRCSVLAAAYQIVYVGGAPERMSSQQQHSLAQIKAGLMSLQHSNLAADQIQSQAAGLASQAAAVLRATPDTAPAVSPAPASFASPAQLTQNSNPEVELFIKLQHPTH